MKQRRWRSRLLFRSYLVLAGSLLLVAIALNYGFGRLQEREHSELDRWLAATFHLIEVRLAAARPDARHDVAGAIADELGVGVQLLSPDLVHERPSTEHRHVPLIDADGDTSYLHDAASIGAIIRLGPITEPRPGLLLSLLPPLFYLSIFVIVGLWLRPLLKDIDVISSSAQRFAADYREPLATAGQTRELQPLARNLDDMAARLSGVLRSQKELIAALSHEMRTPLARMRFALAMSEVKADEALGKKLAAMNQDVQEIDDLVAAMLNYARLDHPDIEMHWQQVPAAAWLEKIAARVPADGVRVEVMPASTPDSVRMDPRLMELALSNLLVNAAKYARQHVSCALARDGDDYLLSVDDDGQGIPETDREKIFKAFARTDDSRNRQTGGYGLGLAVVARIAERHGGAAGVQPSPGFGGARFTIRWPLP